VQTLALEASTGAPAPPDHDALPGRDPWVGACRQRDTTDSPATRADEAFEEQVAYLAVEGLGWPGLQSLDPQSLVRGPAVQRDILPGDQRDAIVGGHCVPASADHEPVPICLLDLAADERRDILRSRSDP
jgi:hypothetical protein